MKIMTNKEAISNLNRIYGIVSPDIQRSLDLAIKALEERPQGDLISRSALKEAINEIIPYGLSFDAVNAVIDNALTVKPCDNCDLYFIAKTKEEMRKGGAKE